MSPRRVLSVCLAGFTLSACATANSAGVPRPSPFPEPSSRPMVFKPEPVEIAAMPPPNISSFSTQSFLESAEKLRGVPYRLGGESPQNGFDCSGYTRYVFGLYRIKLPRTVSEQINTGRPVGGDIRPGDLLFFKMAGPKSPVSHVALALNKDEFIHAPAVDGKVRSEKLSPYWRSRLVTARRIL